MGVNPSRLRSSRTILLLSIPGEGQHQAMGTCTMRLGRSSRDLVRQAAQLPGGLRRCWQSARDAIQLNSFSWMTCSSSGALRPLTQKELCPGSTRKSFQPAKTTGIRSRGGVTNSKPRKTWTGEECPYPEATLELQTAVITKGSDLAPTSR